MLVVPEAPAKRGGYVEFRIWRTRIIVSRASMAHLAGEMRNLAGQTESSAGETPILAGEMNLVAGEYPACRAQCPELRPGDDSSRG